MSRRDAERPADCDLFSHPAAADGHAQHLSDASHSRRDSADARLPIDPKAADGHLRADPTAEDDPLLGGSVVQHQSQHVDHGAVAALGGQRAPRPHARRPHARRQDAVRQFSARQFSVRQFSEALGAGDDRLPRRPRVPAAGHAPPLRAALHDEPRCCSWARRVGDRLA